MDKKKATTMRRISLPYWNPEQKCLDEKFIDIPADLEGEALRKHVLGLASCQSSVGSHQSTVSSQQSKEKKSRWEFVADGRSGGISD